MSVKEEYAFHMYKIHDIYIYFFTQKGKDIKRAKA